MLTKSKHISLLVGDIRIVPCKTCTFYNYRPQNLRYPQKCLDLLELYGVKWLYEKEAGHSHDDATPLSFWLQVTEDFF